MSVLGQYLPYFLCVNCRRVFDEYALLDESFVHLFCKGLMRSDVGDVYCGGSKLFRLRICDLKNKDFVGLFW
jgi:hypothetical protein